MTEKHVDEEWKRKAQAEKERLAGTEPEAGPPPEPGFTMLVSSLAAQAMAALSPARDEAGQVIPPDLDQARFAIDMLDMLSDKSKGNLTPEEDRHLRAVLNDLHLAYVEASQQARK